MASRFSVLAADPSDPGALERADGQFLVLLEDGVELVPEALRLLSEAIDAAPGADMLYGDERCLVHGGIPHRRPAWSPELLRGRNYIGRPVVVRSDLLRQVGGFRDGFGDAADLDLLLRVGEQARSVVAVPHILSTRTSGCSRGERPTDGYLDGARRAVVQHLARLGVEGDVEPVGAGSLRVVRREVPGERVSVVIPTIGTEQVVFGARRPVVVEAVRSVVDEADRAGLDVEIVVVFDPPTPATTLDELRAVAGDRLVLLPFTEPFNYSRKMNVGVIHSTGDLLVLLNDDVETREPGWLVQLLGPLAEPDVGFTGAKLHFEDGSLQHVGHAYARNRFHHAYAGDPGDAFGPDDVLVVNREASGVTGACVGIRRTTYLRLGGFTELLPNNFNDVDLCFKARAAGFRILWVAGCDLFHFESLSRVKELVPGERERILDRWGAPRRDPYLPDWVPEPL